MLYRFRWKLYQQLYNMYSFRYSLQHTKPKTIHIVQFPRETIQHVQFKCEHFQYISGMCRIYCTCNTPKYPKYIAYIPCKNYTSCIVSLGNYTTCIVFGLVCCKLYRKLYMLYSFWYSFHLKLYNMYSFRLKLYMLYSFNWKLYTLYSFRYSFQQTIPKTILSNFGLYLPIDSP